MSITDLEDFEGCGSLPNPTPPPTTNIQWYIKNGTWWLGDYDSGVQAEGEEGLSAYEVAVRNGFVGTEQDWVAGILAGYLHSLTTGNPHNTQIADIPGLAESIEQAGKVKTVNNISPDTSGNIALNKSDIGLSNVDNTSDLNKPISNATQLALNNKANDAEVVHKSGDTMTGTLSTPAVKLPLNVATPLPNELKSTDGVTVSYTNTGGVKKNLAFKDEVNPTVKNITATTYTAIASDYDKWLTFNNANPIQFTIPASTFTAGQSVKGRQSGLGQVEFVAGSGMTLLKVASDSLFTAEQNAVFEIFFETPTQAIVYGRLELL